MRKTNFIKGFEPRRHKIGSTDIYFSNERELKKVRNSFGNLLRTARENQKLHMKNIADKFRICVTDVSDIELGYKYPEKDLAIQWLDLLGLGHENLELLSKDIGWIKLDIKDKTDEIQSMALALEEKWDGIDDDVAKAIMNVLDAIQK